MAGLIVSCAVPVAGFAINSSTATLIQILAPTNQRLKLLRFAVGQGGTISTTASLIIQGSTGTMSSGTPVALSGATETPQVTFTYGSTADPTSTSILESYKFQGGIAVDFGPEPIILAGGQRLGLVITSGGTATYNGHFMIEE